MAQLKTGTTVGGDLVAVSADLALKQSISGKDDTGGYAGLTLFKINFKNVANTFTSFFTNSNSAARTYTFQNRNGTIADDTDLALKAPLASPTLTGTPKIAGATSGTISLSVPAVSGSSILSLPAVTDTLVGKATTDTLTNKSIGATQLTGTIAAARLPTGSVLQVVNVNYNTITSSSSSTYADTGLTASITPQFSNSKILILVSQNGCSRDGANLGSNLRLKLLRGSTGLLDFAVTVGYTGTAQINYVGSCSAEYLDSPATTSSVTYKTQLAAASSLASVGVQTNNEASTITLLEIAG